MSSIGIDFGTTNSVVATWTSSGVDVLDIDPAPGEWQRHGFSRVMPSVFARTPGGEALFGWAAKRSQGRAFEAVKRLFATQQETVTDDAGTSLAVEEVATMLFAELRQAAANNGIAARRGVVTVPANSRGVARHRTKICAGMGGIEVLTLLNEPTAAAMAYALDQPGDQQILVFDWGGGTLDVTVLRSVSGVFMEQASKGLPTSGGIDFDLRLARAIRESVTGDHRWSDLEQRDFSLRVELAKIELSEQTETELQLPGGETRRITRRLFEDAIRPLVEESARPLRQCLDDIGAGPGVIDAVVLVGGTARIPMVRQFVADLIGQEPAAGIDPMTAVGEGAAIAAAILTDELTTTSFFVATEHALGTISGSFDPRRGQVHEEFSVLIPRNHKLPASRTEPFVPLFEDQTSVDIQVIEGDPDLPLEHVENVVLNTFSVALSPPTAANPDQAFKVCYRYDVDGILHVTVSDAVDDTLMAEHEVAFGITEDKRAMVRLAARARQTVESRTFDTDASAIPTSDPESDALLERANVKVIPFLDGEDARRIAAAAQRLQQASPAERSAAKSALQSELAAYPYLF